MLIYRQKKKIFTILDKNKAYFYKKVLDCLKNIKLHYKYVVEIKYKNIFKVMTYYNRSILQLIFTKPDIEKLKNLSIRIKNNILLI